MFWYRLGQCCRLALINLNVKKIPAKVANVVTTTVLKYPVAMAIDEDSMLIIGHHGEIFEISINN